MTLKEIEHEYEQGSVWDAEHDEISGEEIILGANQGEHLLMLRRVLQAKEAPKEKSQRGQIFYTRCIVKGKVTQQTLIPLSIGNAYHDQILCDVIPLDACHILLGRPWQFDKHVHDGHKNTYSLVDNQKKITFTPLAPNEIHVNLYGEGNTREKNSYMSETEVERSLLQNKPIFALLVVETSMNTVEAPLHPLVQHLIEKFQDVFPNNLPSGLPPIRGIEHQIDLIPSAPLLNRAAYRCNSEETKEL
ncbi:uncharacterized protein LOC133303885 [Gastrolobium bilobum]|uniref:uncharacterized protein LOC133303885 n=1 Tax=Gastrolobium bilobum TaxID=150636 RepID=UPI002AAFE6CF|nr:uncharacterized protein LOC133303885 [Gastrolobium bilobum]